MSAIKAVQAELEQKRNELVALIEKHEETIRLGREARWTVEAAQRKVSRLEGALRALEGEGE